MWKKEDVLKALDAEREYLMRQMQNPGYRPPIAEELNTVSVLLRRAQDSLADYDSPERALAALRTLTTVALRCLESYGVPERSK